MMVTEKELIGKVRELRQIKPSKDWVNLTKSQIMGQEPKLSLFSYYLRPAFGGFVAVMVLIGIFSFAQNSLPGDVLYSVKRIAERSQGLFVPKDERPAFQLKIANERLEDLGKAPIRNLAPALSEFQASVSEAAKNLAKIDATTSDSVMIKKIVDGVKKLEENRQKVESLGVVIGEEGTVEFNDALAKMVDNLIRDLGDRSMDEEQEEILTGMKELFSQEKYSEALELYLINQ